MHIGYSVMFQNPHDHRTDADVYHRELGFALQAEMWGFDSLWTVEHHFTDYTLCPDPLQLLTYLAGQTRRIQLGTGVIVLPWHDPVRLAEQITLLDNLSGGRVILGIGRGIARVEYEGFRVPMDTSRERFVEYAGIVLEGLERGCVELDGRFVQQPRRELRPRPQQSFRGRTYAAAVSPDSMPIMAGLGVGVLIIVQKPWEQVEVDLRAYDEAWVEANPDEPPPAPICSGFLFVDEDAERAEELARQYIGDYYRSVLRHYEFDVAPHAGVDGYEFYAGVAKHISRRGREESIGDFVDLMPWGTPDQVIEKVAYIREVTGMGAFTPSFCFGGMPYDEAERNIACFVDHVMPVLKSWAVTPPLVHVAVDDPGVPEPAT
jgi:alkanesulfonate monooxygenase SsuD/methylene tetrahydromethanopterin reductase-like flavin-dependent oxidoreductase (luciferase family)